MQTPEIVPERRRRRPAVSCTLCRKRKIRCNRETPCSNCVRSKIENCIYDNPLPPNPRHHHQQRLAQDKAPITSSPSIQRQDRNPATNAGASSISGESSAPSHLSAVSLPAAATSPIARLGSSSSSSNGNLHLPADDVESMRLRIRSLEEKLAAMTTTPSNKTSPSNTGSFTSIESRKSTLAGTTIHIHRDTTSSHPACGIANGITHKTRQFGQSHWISIIPLFTELFETVDHHLRDEYSKSPVGIKRCKAFAKVIKGYRRPTWPSPPTPDLPPKDVADDLVDGYLRTSEAIYRVIHIPSFRRDYEALWDSDVAPDRDFLVLLKLILAIGAVTYDDDFSLRTSAIRWVYEAQTWLAEPSYKHRPVLQFIQTNILLLLARELINVGGDAVWVSAGALFRRAVALGLHLDPSRLPKQTVFVVEMRRRLWNTILEVLLQPSLTYGGSPYLSLSDFETEPPGNFEDEQLVADDPVPKPLEEVTGISIAIAMRKTFPVRLAICKFLNDHASHITYDETLRLDTELRAANRTLQQTFQVYRKAMGSSSPSLEQQLVDFIIRRYLTALHVPFFGPGVRETAYEYSRRVVVETSQKVWYTACPPDRSLPVQSDCSGGPEPTDRELLTRLTTCGTGIYRTIPMQANLLIGVEILTQMREDPSLGIMPLRPDLHSIIRDGKAWCLRVLQAGETNMKGYMVTCLLNAQVQGAVEGLPPDRLIPMLIKAGEDSVDDALPLLEAMARREQPEGTMQDLLQAPGGPTTDWDFIMTDDFGNAEKFDPMSWIFFDTEPVPSAW